jgi:hypothetical protein
MTLSVFISRACSCMCIVWYSPHFFTDPHSIAREQTREEHGGESLVPLGSEPERLQPQLFTQSAPAFGAGSQKVIGATYGLESIPGMYDNRPERCIHVHPHMQVVNIQAQVLGLSLAADSNRRCTTYA